MSNILLGFNGNTSQDISCNNLTVYGNTSINGDLTTPLNITSYQSIISEGMHLQYNRSNDGKSYIINQKGSNSGGISFGKSDQSNNYSEQFVINENNNAQLNGELTLTNKLIPTCAGIVQQTSRTTPVTINKQFGTINTFDTILAPGTSFSFIMNNSYINIFSTICASVRNYNNTLVTNGIPYVQCVVAANGQANIVVTNIGTTNIDGEIVIFFQIYDLN